MTYSPNKRSDHDSAFLAPDLAQLLDDTVAAKSIAAQTSTPFPTARPSVDFPKFTVPVKTSFIAELANLPLSNANTDHVNVVAYKLGGATQLSSEEIEDMNPSISAQIGNSIADQIVWGLDSAVLGKTTADGFEGLLNLAYGTVTGTVALTNTDEFVKAVYAAQAANGNVTHFVVSPETAQALSLLKTQTGSAENLLAFQQDGTILVAGVPLLISNLVDVGTAGWAVDKNLARLVVRAGTTIYRDRVPQNDSWFISGIARYGWGHLREGVVQRIRLASKSWTLTVTGGAAGTDTYTIQVGSKVTAPIAYNANAAAIKAAIVAVDPGLVAADVTVTGSGPFTIALPATAVLAHGTDAGATTTTVVAA